jgi:hypothetical protein
MVGAKQRTFDPLLLAVEGLDGVMPQPEGVNETTHRKQKGETRRVSHTSGSNHYHIADRRLDRRSKCIVTLSDVFREREAHPT